MLKKNLNIIAKDSDFNFFSLFFVSNIMWHVKSSSFILLLSLALSLVTSHNQNIWVVIEFIT